MLVNGHYYIEVDMKLKNTALLDGGTTEKEVLARLYVLINNTTMHRHIRVKGVFYYQNDKRHPLQYKIKANYQQDTSIIRIK